MKIRTLSLSSAGALACGAACADFSGEWTLESSVGDMPVTVICALEQSGDDLRGTCQPQVDGIDASGLTGTVEESSARWGYDVVFNDNPGRVDYEAELAADGTMTGTMYLAGNPTAFAASRTVYTVPADTPAHIRRAVESAARSDEHRARDLNRKPAEVLTLSGLQEGDHVIEFAAFGQYYTTMLVEAVGPEGKVEMYDLPYTERFGGEGGRALAAEHDNVVYHQIDYNQAEFASGVNAVFNVLYYHDLRPQNVDTAALNAKLYAALVPGGVYVIIDHKAEDGSGWRDAETIHRMGVETIVEELSAAGFELAIDSDLLAHPEDDRTQMVFTPGVRGATDRALFVFRKPAD